MVAWPTFSQQLFGQVFAFRGGQLFNKATEICMTLALVGLQCAA